MNIQDTAFWAAGRFKQPGRLFYYVKEAKSRDIPILRW